MIAISAATATLARTATASEPVIAARGELVPGTTCAPCHTNQFEEWSLSHHSTHDVQCYECHGGLHSAQLLGCKRCHQSAHGHRFENWSQVTRFDTGGDASDYMCLVCHNAHNIGLKKSLIGCYACHGSSTHDVMTDSMHAQIASAITPVHTDEYARERDGIVPRLMSMPKAKAAGIVLAAAPLVYIAAFLALLPFGYTANAAWRRLRGRPTQHDMPE